MTAVSLDKDEARRIELGLLGFERSALGGNIRTILLGTVPILATSAARMQALRAPSAVAVQFNLICVIHQSALAKVASIHYVDSHGRRIQMSGPAR